MRAPEGYYLILDELTAPEGYGIGDYVRNPPERRAWMDVGPNEPDAERQTRVVAWYKRRMGESMGHRGQSPPQPQKS